MWFIYLRGYCALEFQLRVSSISLFIVYFYDASPTLLLVCLQVLSDATESRVGHSEFLQRALDVVRSQIQSRSKASPLLVNPVTTGTVSKSASLIGPTVPLTTREQEQLKYKEEVCNA